MKITVNRNTPSRQDEARKRAPSISPNTERFGAWGIVIASYSIDNSVDVMLDTGMVLYHVPVASKEWVIFDEDEERGFNTGERDLPPVKSRVFVFMPTFTFADCFVAPFSGFNNIDKNISDPFLAEDQEDIKDRITPNGWRVTNDYITGSHKSVSPDEKTSFEIDYGTEDEPKKDNPELHLNIFDNIKADIIAEKNINISAFEQVSLEHDAENKKCTIKVFDTELVIEEGKVTLKPKETEIKVDGNAKIEATGDINVKGKNINVEATTKAVIKAVNAQITGGNLQVNGLTAPGSGPFNCLLNCVFSGVIHAGNMVSNT